MSKSMKGGAYVIWSIGVLLIIAVIVVIVLWATGVFNKKKGASGGSSMFGPGGMQKHKLGPGGTQWQPLGPGGEMYKPTIVIDMARLELGPPTPTDPNRVVEVNGRITNYKSGGSYTYNAYFYETKADGSRELISSAVDEYIDTKLNGRFFINHPIRVRPDGFDGNNARPLYVDVSVSSGDAESEIASSQISFNY
jgi:hypothetical protein